MGTDCCRQVVVDTYVGTHTRTVLLNASVHRSQKPKNCSGCCRQVVVETFVDTHLKNLKTFLLYACLDRS